jgi:hypothetical protein
MSYKIRKMNDECPWYVVFAMAFILPPSFLGTVWLLGWLTNSDPLITEIWRLRGQNSVLRERLEQLEGERRRDTDTLRKVIGKRERQRLMAARTGDSNHERRRRAVHSIAWFSPR